ncbi:SgcJ/EcaC family oxidoreductase [Actinoplanes sp. NPDC049265]|uniref:SgcJ/EcaC family oxidoreductase n=1 Tax=Actinoplanes sp. NPDC049265 TaxID=3363902 RepID=UPI00371D2437
MTEAEINEARVADIEAIRQLVAAVERSQNEERPDEFVALFRADAIWTTGHGRRLYGREAISDFTHRVLPGAMRDTTVTFEVEHVLFVRPDVAAVKVRQVYQAPGGPQVGTPLFILAKEQGTWQLTAAQNTSVVNE